MGQGKNVKRLCIEALNRFDDQYLRIIRTFNAVNRSQ